MQGDTFKTGCALFNTSFSPAPWIFITCWLWAKSPAQCYPTGKRASAGPHHPSTSFENWEQSPNDKKREEGVQCLASRCTGICRKLHLLTDAQVPTEDVPVWCEHTLLSLVPLSFRDNIISWKLLRLARTKHLFSSIQCPWSALGSPYLCAHDMKFSNCLKINLYKYLQKLKKSKEHRLGHSSAT